MEKYIRASKKQTDFIGSLCRQLDMTDPTPYEKYSMDKANKTITRLLKRIQRNKTKDQQQTLPLD